MEYHKKAVAMATSLLESIGASFKIITAAGQEFGTLVVATPKPPRKTRQPGFFKHGELTDYILPHLESIGPLKTGKVPIDERFDTPEKKRRLGGSIGALAHKMWGKRQFTVTDEGTFYGVIRAPKDLIKQLEIPNV